MKWNHTYILSGFFLLKIILQDSSMLGKYLPMANLLLVSYFHGVDVLQSVYPVTDEEAFEFFPIYSDDK